jgi:uncharacterized sulfatase
MDLFHTLRAAANTGSRPAADEDGLDLAPLLQDPTAKLNREELFFHYPHYYETTTPVSAIRSGNWKLLEYFEDGRIELFNLAADPAEQTDLALQQRGKADELRQRLQDWRDSVGAALPQPNPAFAPRTK